MGIIISDDDVEGEMSHYQTGEKIILRQGERHRLIVLNDWGVVAELWQHTESTNPSDEKDIVRIQDDYSRE